MRRAGGQCDRVTGLRADGAGGIVGLAREQMQDVVGVLVSLLVVAAAPPDDEADEGRGFGV